jgi:hypothetical protein
VSLRISFLAIWLFIWPGLTHAVSVDPIESTVSGKTQISVPLVRNLIGRDIETKLRSMSRSAFEDIVIVNPAPNKEPFSLRNYFCCARVADEKSGGAEGATSPYRCWLDQSSIRKIKIIRQVIVSQFIVDIDNCLARWRFSSVFKNNTNSVVLNWAGNNTVGSHRVEAAKLLHQNLFDRNISTQFTDSGSLGVLKGSVGDAPHFVGGQPKGPSEDSNSNGSEHRPKFWRLFAQPFYARNYDAFASGTIIVVWAFLIAVSATAWATRGYQQ